MKIRIPRSFAQLEEIYDRLYRQGFCMHPQKGRLDPYGGSSGRHELFRDYLLEIIDGRPQDYQVLDASCGRGHLLRMLLSEGFDAQGTEISSVLLSTDLRSLPVSLLGYHELDDLDAGSFDVVMSCDVLEHLLSVACVKRAVESLCRLSRKWVMISVGIRGAKNYPQAVPCVGGLITDLHLVRKGSKWWKRVVSQWIEIEYKGWRAGSLCLFGTKKR